MGLLAPLYIAGLAALSLPLVLHLIRRTPHGRRDFSSLMFLTPSPPRLTRRSRLDHLLLLVLRLAALAMLAAAFARPFLREAAMLPLDALASRRVAILLDTSASMRRGDLWQQAVAKVVEALDDLGPGDDVALFTFDDGWRSVVDFAQEAGEPTAGKADLVRGRLKEVVPSWRSTDLGKALVAVAGELEVADDRRQLASQPQLVLITDLARGSRLDALEAYKWPGDVPVVVHALSAKRPTNATIRLLADDEGPASAEPRVRVANAADSTSEEFFIGWRGAAPRGIEEAEAQPVSTYVPAGQSGVIRLPRPAGEAQADRIVLKGDEAEFDNTYYVVPPAAHEITVDWIGDEPADDASSPRYYFELALADDPLRKIDVSTRKADEIWADAPSRASLVVIAAAVPPQSRDALHAYLNNGGTLLVFLKDSVLTSLSTLLDDVVVAEAGTAAKSDASPGASATSENRAYSLLGEIDFSHPLFAPFAGPRYSDFTKIHFWRHRPVTLKEPATTRIVARFDNGDPAILVRDKGAGRLIAFTSGWQPDESQLALSSKFVPLVHAVLDLACGSPPASAELTVGQPVPLPAARSGRRAAGEKPGTGDGQVLPEGPAGDFGRTVTRATIEKPDGSRVELDADTQLFQGADQPGIFRLLAGENEYSFAVNLEPGESNTAPMAPERLEQLGVRFASRLTRDQRAEKLRQQRDTELESHQRLWRWLIAGALGVLVLETWLAGRAARRSQSWGDVPRPPERRYGPALPGHATY